MQHRDALPQQLGVIAVRLPERRKALVVLQRLLVAPGFRQQARPLAQRGAPVAGLIGVEVRAVVGDRLAQAHRVRLGLPVLPHPSRVDLGPPVKRVRHVGGHRVAVDHLLIVPDRFIGAPPAFRILCQQHQHLGLGFRRVGLGQVLLQPAPSRIGALVLPERQAQQPHGLGLLRGRQVVARLDALEQGGGLGKALLAEQLPRLPEPGVIALRGRGCANALRQRVGLFSLPGRLQQRQQCNLGLVPQRAVGKGLIELLVGGDGLGGAMCGGESVPQRQ